MRGWCAAVVIMAVWMMPATSADGAGLYWECRGPFLDGGGAFKAEVNEDGVITPDPDAVIATTSHYAYGSVADGGSMEPCPEPDCEAPTAHSGCTEPRHDHIKAYVEQGDRYVQICIQPYIHVSFDESECWPISGLVAGDP